MTMVPVDTSAADFVDGELYAPDEPRLLSTSMLFLRFGEDYGIDVSWYPERDRNGYYVVTLFQHDWDTQLEVIEEKDPLRVKRFIENIVQSRGRVVVSPPLHGASMIYLRPLKPHAGITATQRTAGASFSSWGKSDPRLQSATSDKYSDKYSPAAG
jgi:hypothetical protein